MNSRDDVQTISHDIVFKGHFQTHKLRLRHRLHNGAWGQEIEREVFHRAPVVVVLPYDALRDSVLLIEQFRAGPFLSGDAHPWIVETVAGVIDSGETPDQTARRECVEEGGLEVGRLAFVGEAYSSPGAMSELMQLYVAEADLGAAGGVHGMEDEGEDIRVWVEKLEAALSRIAKPGRHAGPLMTLLYWLALNRDRLRAEWNA